MPCDGKMKLYSGGVPEQNQKFFKLSDQILTHNFGSADMCTEEDRQMIGRDRGLGYPGHNLS